MNASFGIYKIVRVQEEKCKDARRNCPKSINTPYD